MLLSSELNLRHFLPMGEEKPDTLDFVKDFQEYLSQQTQHVNMISGSVSGVKEVDELPAGDVFLMCLLLFHLVALWMSPASSRNMLGSFSINVSKCWSPFYGGSEGSTKCQSNMATAKSYKGIYAKTEDTKNMLA